MVYEFINFLELTKWTPWTPCSKSCGSGERSRQRECKVPTIRSDNPCGNAPLRQRELCNTQKCPIYTEWSGWSMCSVSCGGGKQSRERACVLPPTSLKNIGCVEIRGFISFNSQSFVKSSKSVKIQSKFSQNSVKMQSKCGKMQSDFTQTLVKL